ncbi:membrane protein insertase YidC [Arsenicicoccus piscis]|uniref:Membrane protein insertase YidC n=1 Tax=Arsenicicoccus piscis TaxID=673954 RepID=A0ABQ6HT73_9MICO|nr:membrane protein insertase YidC [Arsenicicoccus piscis]GMA21582.1 hypothetical protein GCM10025862_36030 [Arsenicicoccus piscis]
MCVIRALITPLFIRQLHASRKMQMLQPELQKIQAKYKGKTDPDSRQAMTQETMELYKAHGTNPLSSCMPILLQMPIFFALFNVLNGVGNIANARRGAVGPITQSVAQQIEASTLFGVRMSDTFMNAWRTGHAAPIVVTLALIVIMSISTFTSQHMAMTKNMPASALDNPMFKQQRILLYITPFFFFISGPNFPIGVLIYWVVSNIWSMLQQFYTIRQMPTPGSPAYAEYEKRQRAKGKAVVDPRGTVVGELAGDGAPAVRQSGQRQQPKRKGRKGSGSPSAGSGGASSSRPASSDDDVDHSGGGSSTRS